MRFESRDYQRAVYASIPLQLAPTNRFNAADAGNREVSAPGSNEYYYV